MSARCSATRFRPKSLSKTALRRRLVPAEREQMIVAEAIRFFAEFGFSAPARALARRLGITQPLLYRYLPTKDHLIQRLYEELVVDH